MPCRWGKYVGWDLVCSVRLPKANGNGERSRRRREFSIEVVKILGAEKTGFLLGGEKNPKP